MIETIHNYRTSPIGRAPIHLARFAGLFALISTTALVGVVVIELLTTSTASEIIRWIGLYVVLAMGASWLPAAVLTAFWAGGES